MIVITGATGQLGAAIADALLEFVPASEVGASVRDPGKAQDLAARGVRVRHGDYDDPASLRDAFAGATQLLLVSSNARARGGDPLAQHRNAIDAAKAAGVERLVYTSQIASSPTSLFPPALDHAATEAMLAESGLAWTALRNGFYLSSGAMLLGEGPKTGVVLAPEDGPVSWATHTDLAAGAAAILRTPGRFEGPTPPLTGAEALDLAALCALASETMGRPVERRVVSEEAMRAGLPEGAVRMLTGLYHAARAGEFAAVDPTLEGLIGRRPTPVRDALAALLAA